MIIKWELNVFVVNMKIFPEAYIENCSNVKFHLLRTFFRKDFQHFAFNDHFTEQELLKIQIQF